VAVVVDAVRAVFGRRHDLTGAATPLPGRGARLHAGVARPDISRAVGAVITLTSFTLLARPRVASRSHTIAAAARRAARRNDRECAHEHGSVHQGLPP